jgi:hypothetical protein
MAKVDPLKAKQKRQKIILAVLGVVFLGILAFEGPKVWKQLNPPPLPPRVMSANGGNPVAGAPTLAAPTLGGAQEPGATTTDATGSLVVSGPAVQDGQLASFSRFASKDPFAQQLSENSSPAPATAPSPSGGGMLTQPGVPGIPGSVPRPGSAVISVNGVLYQVAVATDFPQSSTDSSVVPIFHLVSLNAHTARISIVGGSYSNGAGVVTLKENKPVTLMNTADGTRYTVVLKPQGTSLSTSGSTPTSPAGTTTTTNPTTVTLPPATP